MTNTNETRELTTEEITVVGGGSIVQELMDRFPNGEWHNGSFYPHGVPRDRTVPDYTTGA